MNSADFLAENIFLILVTNYLFQRAEKHTCAERIQLNFARLDFRNELADFFAGKISEMTFSKKASRFHKHSGYLEDLKSTAQLTAPSQNLGFSVSWTISVSW